MTRIKHNGKWKKYIKNDISKTRNTTLSKQKAKDIKKNILKTKNKKNTKDKTISNEKKRKRKTKKTQKQRVRMKPLHLFVCGGRASGEEGAAAGRTSSR